MTATDARPINLLDPYLYSGDPWPVYRWLRNEAPAYRDVNGIVGVSRHSDVSEVERNTELYSSASGSRPFIQMSESMINKDDPFHAQQRKLVSSRFRLAALARHEDHVRRVVTELIDAVAPTGHAEVVADLAAPLPAIMISDLMGYDRAVWPQVKWWSEATMAQAGYLDGDERRPRGSEEASAVLAAPTIKLIEAPRADPRDDLMSVWVEANLDGEPLPVAEIFNEALLLIDGGAETTRSTIGQTVVALSEHPEQRERIIRDPSVLRTTAVDEFIRWSSPILNMRRTVTAEHELHGQHLREGDEILLMYAAANRDERAFDRPDEFDVLRNHNHHVAFGFGPHRCLGANLALLELRVLFEELLRRLPDFRLAPGHQPEFVPGFFTRTYREVHIEFTPEP
jgi:cytochrome P450 family 142 subfamily A polypeptide 1